MSDGGVATRQQSIVAIRGGAVDPITGAGVPSNLGWLYYNNATALLWHKTGSGDTDWTRVVDGKGTNGQVALFSGAAGDLSRVAGSDSINVSDATTIYNVADPTKKIGFDASSVTAGQTRSITMADRAIDLDYLARYFSAGVYTFPSYVDNGDGSITVGSDGVYVLHENSTWNGSQLNRSKSGTVAGGTFTLTDADTNYVIVSYNSGTPVISVITNVYLIQLSDIIPIWTIYRDGTTLYKLEWPLAVGAVDRHTLRMVRTNRFANESQSLILSESATRVVNVSAGRSWYGITNIILSAVASSTANACCLYYHVAGVWTKTFVTQYDNTQYDDGTALQTLTNNRYAVNWIYRCMDASHDMIAIVLGAGNYTLLEAQASQPPAPPEVLATMSVLVGRIIVKKSDATATQIDSAFETTFEAAPVINHNDLAGKQGGTTDEYYHNTAAEYTEVQDISVNKTQMGMSGFISYGGTGNYYSLTTGGLFTVLRSGVGRIKGELVTWSGGQSISLTANKGYYICVSATNTLAAIDVSTIVSSNIQTFYDNLYAMFLNYVILFAVWYDGNENLVGKNNHPYIYESAIACHDHFRLGSVYLWTGAKIALLNAASRTINSTGADLLDDHGVLGSVPDSSSTALSTICVFQNGSGKAERFHRRNFTVSGITTAPAAGDTYTHNGTTYTIMFVNTAKTLIEAWGSTWVNAPLSSGTLTRVTGSGDATITFSAVTTNRVIPSSYLSAGVPVPLGSSGATRYGIYAVYALLDDMQTPSTANPVPTYIVLLSSITYLSAANASASLGTGAGPDMTQFTMPIEIQALEPVLTGFAISDGSTRSIVSYTGGGFINGVRSYKATPTSTYSGGAVAVTAALNVTTDTTGFGGILSTADTDVQKALDTLDNSAVAGPASAVDGNVVLFDGTTGKKIKDNAATTATITNATDSASTGTGALVISGGLGVAKQVFIGSNLYAWSTWINHERVAINYLGSGARTSAVYFYADDSVYGYVYQESTSAGRLLIAAAGAGKIELVSKIASTDTTDSTNINTGGLVLSGGLGVAKSMYVGATVHAITSVYAGSTLINSAGLLLNHGGTGARTSYTYFYADNSTYSSIAQESTITGRLILTATASGHISLASITKATDTTDATSSSTGCLVLSGGLGVAKSIYAGNTWIDSSHLYINEKGSGARASVLALYADDSIAGTIQQEATVSGRLLLTAPASGYVCSASKTNVSDTTEATNTTTAAFTVSGGVGISKSIYAGGTLNLIRTDAVAAITVANTVVCTNLNADLLDGYHYTAFAAASHTQAESTITFTDITTGDVSITAHGYCPKAPNDTSKFLRGDGTWAVGSASDTAAIHNNVASEISAITNKAAPVAGDMLLIEDSADGNKKKMITLSALPAGVDSTAIHKATASEISAITAKTPVIDADFLLIEDSANSNNKKSATRGALLAGPINNTDTTDSTSTTTGAIKTAGGLGVAKNLNVGGPYFTVNGYCPRFIHGLTLSNFGSTAITVAAGSCSDSTGKYVISFAGFTYKVLKNSTNWESGSMGNGYLDNAALAVAWYHVFVMLLSDGSVDLGFDTSMTPSNPAGSGLTITAYRYLGSFKNNSTNTTANISLFKQAGNLFVWTPVILDLNGVSFTSSRQLFTISVPSGIKCLAFFRCIMSPESGTFNIVVQDPDEPDAAPSRTAVPLSSCTDNYQNDGITMNCSTNTSSQIAIRASGTMTPQYFVTTSYINMGIY